MRAIALGLTCNNACIFCAQGELSTQRADSTFGAAGRLRRPSPQTPGRPDVRLDAIEPDEVVAFVGGEPTLDEELPTLVRGAHARGARGIIVQTNGRRFAYRAYSRVMREASDKLVLDVSLQGSTVAMHEYHTQTARSFQQTALGVRHARAEGIDVGVTTVVTRSNYRHLVDVVLLVRGLGAKAIKFVLAERFGRAASAADRIVAPLELVEPHVTRAVREAARFGLGWVVGDRSSSPIVREGFAGLGEVQQLAAVVARAEEARAPRMRLPVMAQFQTVDQGVV
jgi:MoaA/NifB/PqqE/SkfB family radical SAM enzyme